MGSLGMHARFSGPFDEALKEIAHEVHAKLERGMARVGERVETETR